MRKRERNCLTSHTPQGSPEPSEVRAVIPGAGKGSSSESYIINTTPLHLLPIHELQRLHKTAQREPFPDYFFWYLMMNALPRLHPLLPDHNAIHGLGSHHGSQCPAKTRKLSRDTLLHLALIPPVLRFSEARGDCNSSSAP